MSDEDTSKKDNQEVDFSKWPIPDEDTIDYIDNSGGEDLVRALFARALLSAYSSNLDRKLELEEQKLGLQREELRHKQEMLGLQREELRHKQEMERNELQFRMEESRQTSAFRMEESRQASALRMEESKEQSKRWDRELKIKDWEFKIKMLKWDRELKIKDWEFKIKMLELQSIVNEGRPSKKHKAAESESSDDE
jgi:hypothetical protein